MDAATKPLFQQAMDLLLLCSTRAALKVPFLGVTPQLPFDETKHIDLPTGSDLKAYQD